MRGFAITLDAVIALTFFLLAMVVISAQTYQPTAPGDIYLKQLTLDTLTVLEKSGDTGLMLEGNSTAAQQLVESTPKLACIQISVINSAQNVVAAISKSDCTQITGLDIQTAAMPLLYNGSQYIIQSQSWFSEAG